MCTHEICVFFSCAYNFLSIFVLLNQNIFKHIYREGEWRQITRYDWGDTKMTLNDDMIWTNFSDQCSLAKNSKAHSCVCVEKMQKNKICFYFWRLQQIFKRTLLLSVLFRSKIWEWLLVHLKVLPECAQNVVLQERTWPV